MADEPEAAAKPNKKREPTGTRGKPISLYPLTLEEAVKKLARAKPPSPRPKKPAAKRPRKPPNPTPR